MRFPALLSLLGAVAVAGAITMSPPEPDSLGDLCTGLTTAVSIADGALSVKNRHAPDAEIERRRLEAVKALIDISAKFRLGIERGAAFSRAGFIVSNDFIYGLEQFLAGGLHSSNVKEMIKPLAKRVGMLLQDAKEMHLFFGAVQTDVDQLELQLNDDDIYISNYIARVEREIEDARNEREKDLAVGIFLLMISPIFPPAAVGGIIFGAEGMDANEVVQDSKIFRNKLQHSLGDVHHLKVVVEGAKRATATQIQYWSQTLDRLAGLEATSQDWLEDPSSKWTANKVLAQWKVVSQKYSECSHTVSDAGRYIQGRLTILGQS